MKINFEISDENVDEWEDLAYFKVTCPSNNLVSIEANKEGLISFAKQLLAVAYSQKENFIHHWAEENTQNGYWYGNLDEGSLDLSVLKLDKIGRRNYSK